MASWIWGTSQFDETVEKATSHLLPAGSEDIALNLEICDQIRSKTVQPKEAMRTLKARLNHSNPNVQLLALGLTDTCVKNGGDHFLTEVASREFMDNLVSILKVPALNPEVRNKILRLVQNWATAFEGKISLGYVGEIYRTLKIEGFSFPPRDLTVANAVMVDSKTAPEWIDSDVCLRCRTAFTFTNRKHHCRNCGQVFDQLCSSKTLPLPHFGIIQEVRVCDGCHVKLTKTKKEPAPPKPVRDAPRYRGEHELADADLQKAIALSLEEANANHRAGYIPSKSAVRWSISEPPLVDKSSKPAPSADEDDEDLRAAIEASLQEANAPKPSAPAEESYPNYGYSAPVASQSLPTYDLQPLESDAIMNFNQTLQQVGHPGQDLRRYPAVNDMYYKASTLQPKLARSLDDTGRKEQMLSEMHDKLSQAVKLYDHLLTEQVKTPTRYGYHQYVQPHQPPQAAHWAPAHYGPVDQGAPMSPTGAGTQDLHRHHSLARAGSLHYAQPKYLQQQPDSQDPRYLGPSAEQAQPIPQQQWYSNQPSENLNQYPQPPLANPYHHVPAQPQPAQQYATHAPDQLALTQFQPPVPVQQYPQMVPQSPPPASAPQSPIPAPVQPQSYQTFAAPSQYPASASQYQPVPVSSQYQSAQPPQLQPVYQTAAPTAATTTPQYLPTTTPAAAPSQYQPSSQPQYQPATAVISSPYQTAPLPSSVPAQVQPAPTPSVYQQPAAPPTPSVSHIETSPSRYMSPPPAQRQPQQQVPLQRLHSIREQSQPSAALPIFPSVPTAVFPAVPTTAPEPFQMYRLQPGGVESTEQKEAMLISFD